MTPPPPFARHWLTAGCLFVALIPLGFFGGVVVATRWVNPSAVGFDALADGLGGGFVGAVTVFLIGAVGVRWLTPRGRFTAAVLATLVASLCVIYLRSSAEDRRDARALAGSEEAPAGVSRPVTEAAGAPKVPVPKPEVLTPPAPPDAPSPQDDQPAR